MKEILKKQGSGGIEIGGYYPRKEDKLKARGRIKFDLLAYETKPQDPKH